MARWTDGLANANAQAAYENNLAQYGSDYMGKASYSGILDETLGNFSSGIDRLGSDMLGSVSYGLSNIDGDTAQWLRGQAEDKAKFYANLSAYRSTMGDTADLSWGEQVTNPHYWSAQVGNFFGNTAPQVAMAMRTGGATGAAFNAGKVGGLLGRAGLSEGLAGGVATGLGKVAKYGTEIATGAGLENLQNAGSIYNDYRFAGYDTDVAGDAFKQSLNEGWAPAALDYVADRAGVSGKVGMLASAFAKDGGKLLAKSILADAANSSLEAYTEAWQQAIEGRIKGQEGYDKVSMLDPSTWTDDMWTAAKDAFNVSMVVGGMGSAARHVGNKALNKADEMAGLTADNDIINDGSQPPIDVNNTPMADAGIDISSNVNETPDYINETPLGNVEIDDISNASYSPMMEESGFATAVNKALNNRPPEDYAEMMNRVQDERANIMALHGDKPADQLSPRMFEENFVNAGLEPKAARLVSRNLYNDMLGANNAETIEDTNEAPQEESLADKADRLGVTLTDAERANITRENPDKTSIREVERRIADTEKNNAYNEQIRTVAEHRQAYNEDRYANSPNKTFFENEYKDNPYKAQDAAYRVHNAMEARKKDANSSDIKKREQSKNIRNYLAKAGIKPANDYTAEELKSITDYAKHMDNQERTSKNVASYIQNRDMAKEVENVINTLPPKNSPDYLPAKRNLAQQLSKHLVTMGVNGFDVMGPQFNNVRKILSTQEQRMLQANIEEAKRAKEETRRANAQLVERKPQDAQKFVNNKQVAVSDRNIAGDDQMIADYLNSDKVTQEGLLNIQQYLAHTGRETGMKMPLTKDALKYRHANNDVMGGKIGPYNVIVPNPNKKWEARPTKPDHTETIDHDNPTGEEPIVTPYEERKALNPAQPKEKKKKTPSKPRTVDVTTDEQKAKMRDTDKLAKLKTTLQEFGQMNEEVAKQVIDAVPMETKYGKEQKQKYREYVLRQANEDTGDIDLSDDIQKPEDVANKYTDTYESILKDIQYIKEHPFMSMRDYKRMYNGLLAKRNHLVRHAPAFLESWNKVFSEVPPFRIPNVTELMKGIRNGEVKIPQTVLSSFIDKPNHFDENIDNWMARDYMLFDVADTRDFDKTRNYIILQAMNKASARIKNIGMKQLLEELDDVNGNHLLGRFVNRAIQMYPIYNKNNKYKSLAGKVAGKKLFKNGASDFSSMNSGLAKQVYDDVKKIVPVVMTNRIAKNGKITEERLKDAKTRNQIRTALRLGNYVDNVLNASIPDGQGSTYDTNIKMDIKLNENFNVEANIPKDADVDAFKEELEYYLSDMGILSDDNMMEDGNTIKFTASYVPEAVFNNSSYIAQSAWNTLGGVVQKHNSIILDSDTLDNINMQNITNGSTQQFKKAGFSIIENDGTYTLVPVEDDIQNATKGSKTTVEYHQPKDVEMEIMRQVANRTKGLGKLSDTEIKHILQSLMSAVNGNPKTYVSVLQYIKQHPNLEIYVVDRLMNEDPFDLDFNGGYSPKTGRMYLSSDAIAPDNDTFFHELLHSATDFTKTADITEHVNNALQLMREELSKDEGIAGEIYRAVGNDKILKSVNPNDKEALASVIQSAAKNLKRAWGFVRKDGSNTVKNGPISDKDQAKYPRNTTVDGDNSQRARIRQFIQSLSNPKDSVDGTQLLMSMLNASRNADDAFDIPQALINSPINPRDKLFLAAMVMPTIDPSLAKDGSMYKFVNETFSYGNTQLFSNQQIRQHLQDALDDKKRAQALVNKHTVNRKVESAKDTIKTRLAKKQHDIDMEIKANDRIDQAEQKLLADIMEHGGGVIERINPSEDGISFAWFRKMLQSPSSLARKLVPELKPIIKAAYVAARTARYKRREYIEALDKHFLSLDEKTGEDKQINKLFDDIDKRGREFAQPVAVRINGELKYAIIKPNDEFTEFGLGDDKRMRKFVKAEREKGNHVYVGMSKDVYQVISSKDNIAAYKDKANANKVAIDISKAYAKQLGYSDNVWNAYVGVRNTLNKIHKDVNDNQVARGKEPSADLWGYIPREHKRYGVYRIEVRYNPETQTYGKKYTVLTSFDTEHQANRFVDSLTPEKGVAYATIHRDRYQADASQSYEGYYSNLTEEEENLNKVYEKMSTEDAAALFNKVQGNYTETKKFIDHFLKGKDKSMTYDDFQNLINNKERMKEIGLDHRKLQKEVAQANFEKLLKKDKDGLLTHENVSAYLYRSSGAQMWNKHNLKRAGVMGHNEDHTAAIYHYAMTQAKYQGNAPFLDFATRYYEEAFGENYEKQYGRNGTGAKNARQDIVHDYIQRVIGAPNKVDKVLNRIGRELPYIGNFMVKYMGDNWVTKLLNRNMQAMAVFKLGVFRPTAAIAQFGTLANVAALTGFTPELRYAMKEAGRGGKDGKYGKLFDDLEVYEENANQASEFFTDGLDYRKLKVHGINVGKAFDLSMKGFMKADSYTRKVAAIVAYEKYCKDHNLDPMDPNKNDPEGYRKAMEYAKDFVVKTNFDYSDIDSPRLFTQFGTLGKTLLQFKKFGVKEAEFLFTAFKRDDGSIDYKGLGRFMGITMGMAGFMGLPFMGAGDDMLKWLTGKGLSDRAKDLAYEWAGNDQTKQKIALIAMMGAPSMFGVDFSRNIGFGDLTPSNGSDLLGPTLSTWGSLADVARNSHDWRDVVAGVGHSLSPQLGNIYQTYTGNMRDWKNAEDKGAYTPAERMMKLMGFRPARESVENDLAYRLTMANQELKEGKKQAINDFLRDPSDENRKRLKDFGVTGKQLRDARDLKQMSAIDKANKYLPKKSSVEADKVKEQANVYNTFVDGMYDGLEEE
jgi:hypothetical protein